MDNRLAKFSQIITPTAADSALRVKSQAVYVALVFGAVGALAGWIFTKVSPDSALAGPGSFGVFAATAAGVAAALVSGLGYVRARYRPGQEWRQTLSPWTFGVNTESTYNWETEEWSVPINFTVAKLVKFDKHPVSFTAGVRYWAESPESGPDGLGFRGVVTFLFPTK